MSTWNYVKDGQKQGPVETSELSGLIASGVVPPTVLVWKKGMENWVPANTQTEFVSTAPAVSPAGAPPVPATAPVSEATDIENNKIMAILAYIWLLFLVPLLAARQSRFAMYHTNQGIILFLTFFVLSIVIMIVSIVISFIPIVGWIFSILVWPVFSILGLVLVVLGIINAANGVCKPLPVIGSRWTLVK